MVSAPAEDAQITEPAAKPTVAICFTYISAFPVGNCTRVLQPET
jgi:hypothetical protein